MVWRAYTGVIYTVCLTRFRTYKIGLPPQIKPRRRGCLRQINTYRQVPLLVNFLKKPTIRVCFLCYFWSMGTFFQRSAFASHWLNEGANCTPTAVENEKYSANHSLRNTSSKPTYFYQCTIILHLR